MPYDVVTEGFWLVSTGKTKEAEAAESYYPEHWFSISTLYKAWKIEQKVKQN